MTKTLAHQLADYACSLQFEDLCVGIWWRQRLPDAFRRTLVMDEKPEARARYDAPCNHHDVIMTSNMTL